MSYDPKEYYTEDVNGEKTNKIWINGKPIYRIVCKADLIIDGNWHRATFSNPPSNLEEVVEARCYFRMKGNTSWGQLRSGTMDQGNWDALWSLTHSWLDYMFKTNYQGYFDEVLAIIEYTKTTD